MKLFAWLSFFVFCCSFSFFLPIQVLAQKPEMVLSDVAADIAAGEAATKNDINAQAAQKEVASVEQPEAVIPVVGAPPVHILPTQVLDKQESQQSATDLNFLQPDQNNSRVNESSRAAETDKGQVSPFTDATNRPTPLVSPIDAIGPSDTPSPTDNGSQPLSTTNENNQTMTPTPEEIPIVPSQDVSGGSVQDSSPPQSVSSNAPESTNGTTDQSNANSDTPTTSPDTQSSNGGGN